jgi:MFS family permease
VKDAATGGEQIHNLCGRAAAAASTSLSLPVRHSRSTLTRRCQAPICRSLCSASALQCPCWGGALRRRSPFSCCQFPKASAGTALKSFRSTPSRRSQRVSRRPLSADFFDRSGPRTVFGLGLFLLGTGFLSAAFTQKLWQLQVCIGLAAGLGSACLGNVAGSLLLSRWFGPRLPTAMAVVYSAAGAGILLLVPLSQLLIDRFGWRGAYRILGAVLLGTTVLLLLLPWQRLAAGSGRVSSRAHLEGSGEPWRLLTAMHYPPFWTLFSTFLFMAVGVFALSVQVVAYLIEAGFSPL